jgi:hypothetical protein
MLPREAHGADVAQGGGTARRAPTPYQQGRGEGGSTPAAEVEQHLQQVRVINHAVAVHIYTPEVAARAAKREQHCQQVGVIHTAVGVHIAVVSGQRGPVSSRKAS